MGALSVAEFIILLASAANTLFIVKILNIKNIEINITNAFFKLFIKNHPFLKFASEVSYKIPITIKINDWDWDSYLKFKIITFYK